MALRISVIICATSFLLGLLFTHWIADSLTLWKGPVTDEHLATAALYYHILTKGPSFFGWFANLAVGITVLGGTAILWSLLDGAAGNLMFDGGSAFLYCTAVGVYIYSVIPNLLSNFSTLSPSISTASFPEALKVATLDLASKHLVCSVALTGVMVFQAGRWWAERDDEDEEESLRGEESRSDSRAGELSSEAVTPEIPEKMSV
ncbi:uncharacterized protein STEHIDRAFT_44068, partial [Stereum hirsutum FP-91666 SS1]|uniref:uncharacterized protein n=1 Tax=Stereum hirsutum (strain FP-91666) TaxID=721885 RepID=UPI000440B1A0